jgi:hypothetical protein
MELRRNELLLLILFSMAVFIANPACGQEIIEGREFSERVFKQSRIQVSESSHFELKQLHLGNPSVRVGSVIRIWVLAEPFSDADGNLTVHYPAVHWNGPSELLRSGARVERGADPSFADLSWRAASDLPSWLDLSIRPWFTDEDRLNQTFISAAHVICNLTISLKPGNGYEVFGFPLPTPGFVFPAVVACGLALMSFRKANG